MKKVFIAVILFLVSILGIGLYIFNNQNQAVITYYRLRNTPQKIGTRDDLSLGTITRVKGTHFIVKYADGKSREYVVITKTKFENGEEDNLVVGKKVAVIGSFDEDGTYIAKIIRFNVNSPLQMLNY